MLGVVTFATVAVVLDAGPKGGVPIVAMIGAGFAAVMLVMRFVVPAWIVGAARRELARKVASGGFRDSSELAFDLYRIFQTKLIISMALLGGVALFNCVAYIVDRQWWTLAVVGVLLFAIGVQFPTKSRLEYWVHDQLQLMQIDRA